MVVPARHDPINHLRPFERVLPSHHGEGGESPVDTVHPKMLGEVVRELISFLERGRREIGVRPGVGEGRHDIGQTGRMDRATKEGARERARAREREREVGQACKKRFKWSKKRMAPQLASA